MAIFYPNYTKYIKIEQILANLGENQCPMRVVNLSYQKHK